jgi:hypothetical protein
MCELMYVRVDVCASGCMCEWMYVRVDVCASGRMCEWMYVRVNLCASGCTRIDPSFLILALVGYERSASHPQPIFSPLNPLCSRLGRPQNRYGRH